MRPHFVKARVKVHVYADGSHAVFHGPRCIGRYDANGTMRCEKRRLNPLGGEPVDGMDKPPACPPRPRGRTEPEEADIQCATKTGQLNSLSTREQRAIFGTAWPRMRLAI